MRRSSLTHESLQTIRKSCLTVPMASRMCDKLIKKGAVSSLQRAKSAVNDYVRGMTLKAIHDDESGQLVVPEPKHLVDKIWKFHLVHTLDYARFCSRLKRNHISPSCKAAMYHRRGRAPAKKPVMENPAPGWLMPPSPTRIGTSKGRSTRTYDLPFPEGETLPETSKCTWHIYTITPETLTSFWSKVTLRHVETKVIDYDDFIDYDDLEEGDKEYNNRRFSTALLGHEETHGAALFHNGRRIQKCDLDTLGEDKLLDWGADQTLVICNGLGDVDKCFLTDQLPSHYTTAIRVTVEGAPEPFASFFLFDVPVLASPLDIRTLVEEHIESNGGNEYSLAWADGPIMLDDTQPVLCVNGSIHVQHTGIQLKVDS